MTTQTAVKQKFKPGDRIVQNLNNPAWGSANQLPSLINKGIVIEYQKMDGCGDRKEPYIRWENGAVGFVPAHTLALDTSTESSTENSTAVVAVIDTEPTEPAERLAYYEEKIAQSRAQLMVGVGTIRDEELWRASSYASFAEYCERRWGWKKSTSYEMATGGAVVAGLLNSGIPESDIPESTSALNAIAQAPPTQQASVLQQTQARDGKVTANGVKKTLKYTPSVELMRALWGQLGTVTASAASPEKLTVSGPLFESPLEFGSVKEAQQHWELNGQRLCAIAYNKYPPDPKIKQSLQNVPCKITSSGRNADIGQRASLMGDWHSEAIDARGNRPRPWDYPILLNGSPILRAFHLFQVKIDWQETHDWKPAQKSAPAPAPTPSSADYSSATPPIPALPAAATYAADDQRGQQKSDLARSLPTMAPFPTGQYSLIVADPPWKYTLRETDASHRGRTPYPTLSDQEVLSLPMQTLSAQDAYILLWTTNAHLPLAIACLARWGFTYKGIHTWVKQDGESGKTQLGLGHYGRGCTEHYLVGIRGNPGAWSSLGLTDIPTVIFESRKEHSKKPTQFWQIAQALKVKLNGEAIELFARGDRPDWDTWGLEA